MSFYRTYRPQVISEIDNTAIRRKVLSYLGKDRSELPHAFFFSGPKGTGKTTTARVIAKLFNCEKFSAESGPCGQCGQCTSIAKGTNLDVFEIDAASNRGIDEIRALRERIGLMPSGANFSVYIIDEVHMLTTEAFNALLKTLEEPPAHAVFVLATTDPQKVPPTIKSRSVQWTFPRANADEIHGALARILSSEKMAVNAEALEILVQSADGSFRDAVKFLEQVSFEKGEIDADRMRSALSLPDGQITADFIGHLTSGRTKDALTMVESLVQNGTDMKAFFVRLLTDLETRLIASAKSGQTDMQILKKTISVLTHAYADLRWSPLPQLPLELAVVELASFDQVPAATPVSTPKPWTKPQPVSNPPKIPKDPNPDIPADPAPTGLITIEKLAECWKDVIEELKQYNHSVAGVMRSARPKSVADGTVTIETNYRFHLDKLSESKTKDALVAVLKKLFGERVRIVVELAKK